MNFVLKFKLRLIHSLNLFGFDILRARTNIKFAKRFYAELSDFKKLGGVVSEVWPIMSDYNALGGTSKGHYFHQDLLVARYIYEKNPKQHVDIGSRVDGFVAHVATFREIVVIDINETPETNHENITFQKIDLMDDQTLPKTDSLSCLHAIEHFGLGRYGDRLDPSGHLVGIQNMIKMLEENGTLYISFPISQNPRVVFNAHRILHPHSILEWTKDELELVRFDYVNDLGNLINCGRDVDLIEPLEYGCGIYTFRKVSTNVKF